MNDVHIRKIASEPKAFCGALGSSISKSHFRKHPEHIASLKMCSDCVHLVSMKEQEKRKKG